MIGIRLEIVTNIYWSNFDYFHIPLNEKKDDTQRKRVSDSTNQCIKEDITTSVRYYESNIYHLLVTFIYLIWLLQW